MSVKILLGGYYGFDNIGDEMILEVMLSHLKIHYGEDGMATVLSNRPSETHKKHGVKAVSRWNILTFWRHVWRSDLFILGGGGLLQDKTSFLSLLYYLIWIQLSLWAKTPVFLYAIGVESLNRRLSRLYVKYLLTRPHVTITVRDKESKMALERIGVPSNRIHLTRDPVFAVTAEKTPVNRQILIVPRAPGSIEAQALFDHLVGYSGDMAVFKVALFQPVLERSAYINEEWGQALAKLPMTTIHSMEDLKDVVAHSQYVVSSRFHGLVMAALFGRPFLGVGDPNKVGRFCKEWNMPFLPWSATVLERDAAFQTLFSMSSAFREERLREVRKSALKTMEYLI